MLRASEDCLDSAAIPAQIPLDEIAIGIPRKVHPIEIAIEAVHGKVPSNRA